MDAKVRNPDEVSRAYDGLIGRFLAWAQTQEAIRAVIQVGSRTRADHPADEWADVDLMLYLTTPDAYNNRLDWAEAIAPVWLSLPSRTAGGDNELLVLFEGGYNVDFVFCPVQALDWLRDHVEEDATFQRGYRVLHDPDGLAARIPFPTHTILEHRPPTEAEFDYVCSAFWYISIYIARQIRRGDVWLAQMRSAQQKELVLRMLEWHAGVTSGWQRDTWHNGRFMGQWADKRALQAVPHLFSAADEGSMTTALLKTTAVFQWLAKETASGLSYTYPAQAEVRSLDLILEALGN